MNASEQKPSLNNSRMTPEQRRQNLIAAAIRCIIKDGSEGLSVRTVCKEAGVSAGLLAHHFPGKEALIIEAYRSITKDIYARIQQKIDAASDATALEKLRLYIDISFREPVLDQDFLKVWLVFWNLSQQKPEISELRDSVSNRVIQTLNGMITDIKDELKLHDTNTRLAAIGLSALMDGLWLEWSLNPNICTPNEAAEVCQCWVDTIINNNLSRLDKFQRQDANMNSGSQSH